MQGQTSSYVLTTLLAKPSGFSLTTLATVKDELGITNDSEDQRLTRYISGESANIARYCNRVFGLATWQDEFRPQHGVWGEGVRAAVNPLKLSKWPLAASAVAFTGNTYLSQLVDGISSTSALFQGMPVFGSGIPVGAYISSVMPTSILLSVAATIAASAVSLTAGLSVIETVAGTSTQLAAGTDFQVDIGSMLPGDEGLGALYRLNEQGNPRTWPAGQIVVIYQAGYALPSDSGSNQTGAASLPSDLEDICTDIVVGRYRAKGRDPLIRSQDQPQLGRIEYWVGAAPGQTGPYPNEIMAVLDRYRIPVTAAA